ncbi:MAG: HD domain-containing protein, partial [Phycisphaerales bacterium]|nr:HD domain-containing protein [Phycisphaerales bacterium]
MLRVPIIQAEPGMRLSLPVHRPLSNDVLLREGFALDRMTIGRLRELRVPEVWIDYPGAERIRRFVSPEVYRLQANLVHQTSDLFERVQCDAGAKLDYAAYRTTMSGLIDQLLANHHAAVHLSEIAGAGESQARHATTVCLLSLLIGLRLQGYLVSERPKLDAVHARDTTNLGIGAMLHDVGLSRLPAECARCEFDLDGNDPQWRSHVQKGYEMVIGNLDASAAIVVLDHHQSWDGHGFPEHGHFGAEPAPRHGHDIHVFARIVAAADAYDRLLHRVDGGMWPRVRAMNTLLNSPLNGRFDPVVLAV